MSCSHPFIEHNAMKIWVLATTEAFIFKHPHYLKNRTERYKHPPTTTVVEATKYLAKKSKHCLYKCSAEGLN